MTPEAAGRDSASCHPGESFLASWRVEQLPYAPLKAPGTAGEDYLLLRQGNTILHWRYSSRLCLPAAPSSLDLPSYLPWELAVSSSAAEGLRKPKERMEEKKSQGLAKVFSCYQPLRASLSGVWEAGQAEPRSGMEPPPHIWDAGFDLG